MKFTSILTVCLASAVFMAQANPIEKRADEKLGQNVVILGVRFQEQYATLTALTKHVGNDFDSRIAEFNKELPIASKADNATVSQFLVTWSGHYADLVGDLKTTAKGLQQKIEVLKQHLGGI